MIGHVGFIYCVYLLECCLENIELNLIKNDASDSDDDYGSRCNDIWIDNIAAYEECPEDCLSGSGCLSPMIIMIKCF